MSTKKVTKLIPELSKTYRKMLNLPVGVTWGVSFVRDVLRDAVLCSLVA